MFVALQQLEGHVVAPQVFRISLRINPILIILALLIGDQLYGIAGALVALPVIAVIRQTVLYLRRHLVLEPWGVLGGAGASAPALFGTGPGSAGRCPDCGVRAGRRRRLLPRLRRLAGAARRSPGERPAQPLACTAVSTAAPRPRSRSVR